MNNNIIETYTVKTSQYKRIIGTKIFLIVPDSFEIGNDFKIKKKNSDAFVEVDVHNVPFYVTMNIFKKTLIQKRTEFQFSEFKLNGKDAVFIEFSKGLMKNQVLLLGDTIFSSIVKGESLIEDKDSASEIGDILKSIYYDDNYILDPLESFNFYFDLSISGFKLKNKISGYKGNSSILKTVLIFTKEGVDDSEEGFYPSFNISSEELLIENDIDDELKNYTQGFIGHTIKKKEYITYEKEHAIIKMVEVISEFEGDLVFFINAIVLAGNKAITFQCATSLEIEMYQKVFRDTINSIRIKNNRILNSFDSVTSL